MTEDQVVTTGVDVTALSGLELRKAVAMALGWRMEDCGGWHPNDEDRGCRILPPAFESSLDACFAPGGPVERLRNMGGRLAIDVRSNGTTAVSTAPHGLHWTHGSESLPETVCRAFLTAVSETAVQGEAE